MAMTDNDLKNIPIHSTLEEFDSAIGEVRSKSNTPPTASMVARLAATRDYLFLSLKKADPVFLHHQLLSSIDLTLTKNIIPHLRYFSQTGTLDHLMKADANLMSLINHMAKLLPRRPLVEELSDKMASDLLALSSRFGELEAERARISTTLATLQVSVSSLPEFVSSQGALASQALNAAVTSLQASAGEIVDKCRLEAESFRSERKLYVAETEQALRDDVARMTNDVKTLMTQVDATREEAIRTAQIQIDEAASKMYPAAAAVLKAIEEKHEEAKKLVGIIGSAGFASGYQKTANQAQRAKWLWQGFAVLSMLGVVSIAVKNYVFSEGGDFSWELLAGRAFASATLGVLAAYAARQGDKAQELERRNRRLELELASIGPFLASLSQEKQEEIRVVLAKRTFGRDEQTHLSAKSQAPANLAELIEEVLRPENAKAIMKALIKTDKDG
ncbi:hypothetical protein VZQ01_06790 [Myxococcus faecalis]|uniref:hypothetical protein n=1 Tax=Myxococcus faecalis TaxID=3115646 RepID=UPI003CEA8159